MVTIAELRQRLNRIEQKQGKSLIVVPPEPPAPPIEVDLVKQKFIELLQDNLVDDTWLLRETARQIDPTLEVKTLSYTELVNYLDGAASES